MLATLLLIGTICISGAFSGKRMTCREYVNEQYRRTQPERLQRFRELPECDHKGNYKLKQCHSTGTRTCYCVKRISGKRITAILGVSSSHQEAKQMTCQCAYDQIQTTWDLNCNPITGDFKYVRCVSKRCFCAERTGEPIRGYRSFEEGSSNCWCARGEHDSGEQGRSKKCKVDGSFKPKQDNGSETYCVNRFGDKVGPAYPIYSPRGKNLRCGRY